MSVRQNVATNLRALCEERSSIAQVCREAGINRQQFNRYLTGETLPNRASLEKICHYFGITEDDLFQAPAKGAAPDLAADAGASVTRELRRILGNITSGPPANIPDGTYFVYFLMPEPGAGIARSVMFMRTEGNLKVFRRITKIATRRSANWHYFQGDHTGIVLERRHWLNFTGISRDGREEPSLMAVQLVGDSTQTYSGKALVYGQVGPLALPVVLQRLPSEMSARRALRGCNIYDLDSDEISPVIRNFLESLREKIAKGSI